MDEIRIVGPGKTRGYPYPVCMKLFPIIRCNLDVLMKIPTSLCFLEKLETMHKLPNTFLALISFFYFI